MQFTDLTFLFIFLPMSLILYHIFRQEQLRKVLLLLLSLLFYACGTTWYIFLLIICVVIDFFLGCFISLFRGKISGGRSGFRWVCRCLLAFGIILNVGILVFYKYSPSSVLPLGLSIFTFKAISYLADVYKGKIPSRDFLGAANYLCFWGQIQSGPISRYAEMQDGRLKPGFQQGVYRFMVGFSKKVLLANVLGNITTEIFDNTFAAGHAVPASLAWLGSICYSLQLFYDFAGYSDMAIGISYMFDIDCPENFNYPYTASSISDFWRRWHISLGQWFKDYIYIPMGGSRNGYVRMIFSLFVVWLLTGIWHGSTGNFIFWGLAYFILVTVEKVTGLPRKIKPKVLRLIYRIAVLLTVNLLWVIFRIPDLNAGMRFIGMMFTCRGGVHATSRALFLLNDYKVFIITALLLAVPTVPRLRQVCGKNRIAETLYRVLSVIVITALFVLSVSFIVSGQNNPFLYADF